MRKRIVTVVLAAALGVALGLGSAATAVAEGPNPTVISAATISCAQAAARVTIAVSSDLDPGCTYTGGFDITASNVVLDCRGALIKGSVGTRAIGIFVSTPVDVDMENVTIRNCRVDGFFNNVHLRREGFRTLTAGREYDHHLRNIVIEDSTFTNSVGVGIYVDDYVSETTMRRLIISGSGSTGVYLDAGSRANVIAHNVIAGNGFKENGPEGDTGSLGGVLFRFWGPGREGIAVDGSRENQISQNWIVGNSAGGVFLYTNCGENVHTNPDSWVEHRYGSEHNWISKNLITGGETGVWIASRMGENVYPMDCSDVPYAAGPILAVTLDRAANNSVRSNTFDNLTYGIRVEDDGASLVGNQFAGPDSTHHAIIVGTPYRTQMLGHPVTNAVVSRNQSTIVGNADPFRWVDGISAMTDSRNRAHGHRSRFCEAPPVPRAPLIFVYAFAVQNPNGPPETKPEYTVPALGSLAPCGARPSP